MLNCAILVYKNYSHYHAHAFLLSYPKEGLIHRCYRPSLYEITGTHCFSNLMKQCPNGFNVTPIYFASDSSTIPLLFYAIKYRARNHMVSGSFEFCMMVPVVTVSWCPQCLHWYKCKRRLPYLFRNSGGYRYLSSD